MSPYGWHTYGEIIFWSFIFLWLLGKLNDRQARKRAYRPFQDHNFANAGFATDKQCEAAGMFGAKGIRLGYSRESGRLLRTSKNMHHLTIAGTTGGGKGSSILVPLALDSPKEKLNFTDPKCESTPIFLKARLKVGPVYVVNPFGLNLDFLKGTVNAKYNFLEPLCDGTIPRNELYATAMKLAHGIVWEESDNRGDRFFPEGARALCADIITGVVLCGLREEKNLPALAQHINGNFLSFCRRIAGACPDPRLADRFREYARALEGDERALASSGGSGIINTLKVAIAFMNDPAFATTFGSSDFSLYTDAIDTVSWVMPLNFMDVGKKINRLVTEASLLAYLRPGRSSKVFLVSDETAQMGYMESLYNAIGMARGFGVRLVTVWTDIPAMSRVYSNFQSFLANSTVVLFPTNDPVTSKYASERCGITEVPNRSKSVNEDREGKLHVGVSIGSEKRPVMHDFEVATMPRDEALIFTAGLPALRVKLKRYFEDSFFRGKYGPNPYRTGRSED